MYINNLHNPVKTQSSVINKTFSSSGIAFKQRLDKDCFVKNFDAVDYIELTPDKKKLKSVYFYEGTTLAEGLGSLAYTKNSYLKKCLSGRLHPVSEFEMMYHDISRINEISSIKVKSLLAMGCNALVFETSDGNIIKLTPHNHFPGNRKQECFDLPCIKQGKADNTYFYIQEKAKQDNITAVEIENLVKKIESKGYYMQDYLRSGFTENINKDIRKEQFGRTKDGLLYLIDPGCAIKKDSKQNDDSINLRQKISRFF